MPMEEIIQALNAEKARLEQELDRVNKLLELAGGSTPRIGRPTAEKGTGKRGRRARGGKGQIKEAVVAEIQAAGPAGIAVKDIASKIGVPASRLGTWFATTGKRVKEIQRLNRGVYHWGGESTAPVETAKESPKEDSGGKKRKK